MADPTIVLAKGDAAVLAPAVMKTRSPHLGIGTQLTWEIDG